MTRALVLADRVAPVDAVDPIESVAPVESGKPIEVVASVQLPPQVVARSLRVRPAPRREPPFDDELGADSSSLYSGHDRPLPFVRRTDAPTTFVLAMPRGDLPDPALWARRLLVGIVEVAGGRRPLQQLVSLLTPSIAHGLRADFHQAFEQRRQHWTHAAIVRSVRASEPRAGVAEVCATLQLGRRVRAVAMRAESHQGKWRCTRLQLG